MIICVICVTLIMKNILGVSLSNTELKVSAHVSLVKESGKNLEIS